MTENSVPSSILSDINTDVPIYALRIKTRNLVSSLLNTSKVIPNDEGLPRDWRGLAHLIGLKSEKIPALSYDADPTSEVLQIWQKQTSPPYTVKQLQAFLGELDRFDIIDDTTRMIEEDISLYTPLSVTEPRSIAPLSNDTDKQILTNDDLNRMKLGLGPQRYDAFVVFADEDINFATELMDKLEKQYNHKLCFKERDFLAGIAFEHKAIIELISERCNRLIVLISPAYLKSSINTFVINYALALGIEQGQRKIIPCLIEQCEPPRELRNMFMLNYRRTGMWYDFWQKLSASINSADNYTTPKSNITRSVSHEIKSASSTENPTNLKPVLTHNKSQVKLKKDGVKFGSMSDITIPAPTNIKHSPSVNGLNSENSTTNTIIEMDPAEKKKHKNKINFMKHLKKILPKTKTKVAC